MDENRSENLDDILEYADRIINEDDRLQEKQDLPEETEPEEPAAAPEKSAGVPDEQPEDGKTEEEPAPRRFEFKLPGWARIVALVLAAALLVGVSVYVTWRRQDDYIWENYSVTVSQEYADGTVKRTTTLIGDELVLEEPPAVESMVFAGWRTESGELVQPRTVLVEKTETYRAEYVPDLDRVHHVAYVFPLGDGQFHLDEPMTRGDAALMIYNVMLVRPEPGQGYSDIDSASDYFLPAATLQALGVGPGSHFHPEDEITRRELFEMLGAFFPPAVEKPAFHDLKETDDGYGVMALAAEQGWIESGTAEEAAPNALMTRGEIVLLMNRILNRGESSDIPRDTAWGILELQPEDSMYVPLMEACISHEYESGTVEKWISGTPITHYEEGPYFQDMDFYYVDGSGRFVRNAEVNGFRFGSDGKYTSGDPELDELVDEVVAEYWEPGITREELLRKLYDFTSKSFQYRKREFYKAGDRTYAPEGAKIMLSERSGNCYNYAATFCMLARRLGYDAYVCSGTVGRNKAHHGWCEINTEEGPVVCDPELEMKMHKDLFWKTYKEVRGWDYVEAGKAHA